jgi:NTP pyrophosphatase (non-canonical NTP hydrolase)
MELQTYQFRAGQTAIYPGHHDCESYKGLAYVTLGLAGEAGEIANKVKKIARDNDGVISEQARLALKRELGDVLWYVAQLATQLGVPLDAVAWDNINKLHDRAAAGTLQGSGDNR